MRTHTRTLPLLAALLGACASPAPRAAVQEAAAGGASTYRATDRAAALRSLIEAERGFAAMAAESGTRAAFLANLGDSAVMFVPEATVARPWISADSMRMRGGFLAWEPAWADVSRAGDMGYTGGPYELRRTAADTAVIGRGTFNSVWTRAPGTPWRVAVDLGTTHAAGAVRRAAVVQSPAEPPGARRGSLAAARAELLRLDADSSGAWAERITPWTRLLRPGEPPLVGRDAIRAALPRLATLARRPIAARVAASNDLAYSYGTYDVPRRAEAPRPAGHYLRVWRRGDDGAWRLVHEVVEAMPRRR
ncbi:MAG TPA: nuclear transport factor 2 family protein [Gemmatimonadaceae bacterium]|nr:nuclear transport factor 2 family protein [Gemmatimonadaceae bacterium]